MMLSTIERGGGYVRVVGPAWIDPGDPSFAAVSGGRWNPPGAFGALYLCASVAVAAANARAGHADRAIKLFDLLPDARPMLARFDIPPHRALDVITPAGIAGLALPERTPFGVPWSACQPVAAAAYAAGLDSLAAWSNAEATATSFVGEELAIFDRHRFEERDRVPFDAWYPDPIPG